MRVGITNLSHHMISLALAVSESTVIRPRARAPNSLTSPD